MDFRGQSSGYEEENPTGMLGNQSWRKNAPRPERLDDDAALRSIGDAVDGGDAPVPESRGISAPLPEGDPEGMPLPPPKDSPSAPMIWPPIILPKKPAPPSDEAGPTPAPEPAPAPAPRPDAGGPGAMAVKAFSRGAKPSGAGSDVPASEDHAPAPGGGFSEYGELRKALGEQDAQPNDDYSWIARSGEDVNAAFMRRKPDYGVANEIAATAAARRAAPGQRFAQTMALQGAKDRDKDRAPLPANYLKDGPKNGTYSDAMKYAKLKTEMALAAKNGREPEAKSSGWQAGIIEDLGSDDPVKVARATQFLKLQHPEKPAPPAPWQVTTQDNLGGGVKGAEAFLEGTHPVRPPAVPKPDHFEDTFSETQRHHKAMEHNEALHAPVRLSDAARKGLAKQFSTQGAIATGFARAGVGPEIANEAFAGDDKPNLAANKALFGAESGAIKQQTQRATSVDALAQTLNNTLDTVTSNTGAVSQIGVPALDEYGTPAQSRLGGDVPAQNLIESVKTAQGDYARLLSLSAGGAGVPSDADMRRAEQVISVGMTPEQSRAAKVQIARLAKAAQDAARGVRDEHVAGIGGGDEGSDTVTLKQVTGTGAGRTKRVSRKQAEGVMQSHPGDFEVL